MQILSNIDALFLDLDTKNTPMHIGSLSLYDQSTAPGGRIRYKDILRFYESRLSKAKCFRRRLVEVPLKLGNPYWIEDPHFNVEFHVRHIALPKPGDWRQLCIQVARLFSRPLDMSKPLWEVYVIEGLDQVDGLPKGCFAILHKVHHAAIDGVSGAEIIAATHDLTNDASSSSAANGVQSYDDWHPETLPSESSMFYRGVRQQLRLPATYGRYIRRFSKRWINAWRWFLSGSHHLRNAPMTRFNQKISPHRVFDGVSFDLERIKAIKNARPGTTVNDVIVSICGGAMHHYLRDKNELPAESILAMMPKSIRSADAKASEGNQISIMRVANGSHIADPLQRLDYVRQSTSDAKELLSILGENVVPQTLALFNPVVAKLTGSAMMATKISESLRLFNTVITNVPGPPMPLYFMGCKMLNIFGMGPPGSGLGLFQVVFSYDGKITVGAVACREMIPDPAFYTDCLRAAFDELERASGSNNPPRKRRAKKKKSG